MDETPIHGEVRVLDFSKSEEPSEEFDYDAAFAGGEPDPTVDWDKAVPQFTEAPVLDFPQAQGTVGSRPVTVNREELIFLSASLGAGQLDVALTIPEAEDIFDALGTALA